MNGRRRVAVVVQRCHESVLGGSEAHAWQYVQLLREAFEVEVLTSTATDYVTWEETLPAGEDARDGIAVRRFPVAVGRSGYWHQLNHRLNLEAATQSFSRACSQSSR